MATGYPLHVAGIKILTTEALYQACRFPHLPRIQEIIIQQSSPMTAKMKSKPHRKETRKDWDAVRVGVMNWCLKVKLVQNWYRFSELLLSTGNKPIVEQSRRDDFWGAIPDSRGHSLIGSNVLGRLLMGLRERLKYTPDEFSVAWPLPISSFTLLGRDIEPIRRTHLTPDAQVIEQKLHLSARRARAL